MERKTKGKLRERREGKRNVKKMKNNNEEDIKEAGQLQTCQPFYGISAGSCTFYVYPPSSALVHNATANTRARASRFA